MTPTRKRLRFEDLKVTVEDVPADEPRRTEAKNGRRFEVYSRPASRVRDDLDDLWDNVPV